MKQSTTPEQTAKLVELGFAPKMRIKGVCTKYGTVNVEHEAYFDVGKLIEVLPSVLDNHKRLCIESSGGKWWVAYINLWDKKYFVRKDELIDALYAMILQLREEGVI